MQFLCLSRMMWTLTDVVKEYLAGLPPVRDVVDIAAWETCCESEATDALWRYERLQTQGEWDVQSSSPNRILFGMGDGGLISIAFEHNQIEKGSPLTSLRVLTSLAGLIEGAFVEDWYEYEVLDMPRLVQAAPLRSLMCCTDRASANAVYSAVSALQLHSRSPGFSLHLHFVAMGAIANMSAANRDKELAQHLGLTLRKMIREWEDWEGKPTFREWAMLDIVDALRV